MSVCLLHGQRLPQFKPPSVVQICRELPKNPSGKIIKEQLRQKARELTSARHSEQK